MNREDIIRMAREADREWDCDRDMVEWLEWFAALVAAAERKRLEATAWGASKKWIVEAVAAEREACARVAESLWQQFQDTKDAHERNSLEPFMLGRFGFDQSTIQQSRRIADAIRARGQA